MLVTLIDEDGDPLALNPQRVCGITDTKGDFWRIQMNNNVYASIPKTLYTFEQLVEIFNQKED